jgi:hypothetical protein
MKPWSKTFAGRVEEHTITSELLRGNRRGDPHERPIYVYVPPGYDTSTERLPTIYMLQGWTGQIDMWRNRNAFRPNALELFDELFESKKAPPAILVFPDAWTSWGGSQFLDSPALGPYHSYLCNEVVAWVDAHYRTNAHRDHRAVTGKSSGGSGAMMNAMLRPDVFGAFATHAGDALFEHCYQPHFPKNVRVLRDAYDGSFENFFADHATRPAFSKSSDMSLLSDWSMASCYSADADGTVQLPYDLRTGELRPEIWARWLDNDPVRLARKKHEALRSMRAVYIDAGRQDDFNLDLGATAFHREVVAAATKEVFFELFNATHFAIEYRYPKAVSWLLERMQ